MDSRSQPEFMTQAIARWQEGDMDGFLDHFLTGVSPSATWRIAGHSRLGSVLRGHDGIRAFFKTMFEISNKTFRAVPIEWLASKDHLAMFLHVTGDTPKGPVDVDVVHFATIGPDGKLDKSRFLPSDVRMHDRLFG